MAKKTTIGAISLNLTLSRFDYNKFTPESFAEYQDLVRSLDQRTNYDWTEYKAVGKWKQIEDENGDFKDTNILIGIELVSTEPLKHTRMEPRHIEYWMTGRKGRLVMGGLNAQIYSKENNRANSRYYLLKQVEEIVPEQTIPAE